jgi:exodeoxyribonuclease VII large subunit
MTGGAVGSLFDRPALRRSGARGDREILTVSELNACVRDLLEGAFAAVWVEGEISNLRTYPSGHTYFTLKDPESQVAAVLFRSAAAGLRFRPEDGLKVLIRGRVSLYEPRGSYQIIVEGVEPAGLGELQLAFEQLKAKLLAEGLFDADRKRPLPLLPRRIGIVTSPVGAAIRDILRVLHRRFAGLEIVIAPARVQGEAAAEEIIAGVRDLSRLSGVDVIIVTRGGGSLEDLWPFNEESVARAIVGSPIPVISAVGHEVDITISDLVADLRAPTPSAAAEMVVRSRQELLERLAALLTRLGAAARLLISTLRRELDASGAERAFLATRGRIRERMQRVDDLTHSLRSHLAVRTERLRHRVEILGQRISPRQLAERLAGQRAASMTQQRLLRAAATSVLESARNRVAAYGERLTALSPLAVLARGYAICRLAPSGAILKDAAEASPGGAIRVRLHRGGLDCEVKEVHHATREEGL